MRRGFESLAAAAALWLLGQGLTGCVSTAGRSSAGRPAEARADRSVRTADDWIRLGNRFYDEKEWAQARDAYLRALEGEPDEPAVLADLGVAYWNLGEVEPSRTALERSLGIDPDHWQALYNLVIVYAEGLDDHATAGALLERLKRLRTERPELEIPDLSPLEAVVRRGS